MKTFFTADTHFDHENILNYCERPFKSVKIMNNVLVRNWNSRVTEHDVVIFLGDFAFRKAREDNVRKWLSLLHGHITFVRGNHDNNNSLNTKIESLVIYISKRYIYCTHRPANHNPYYKINLVGHIHEKWRIKQTRKGCYLVNVGVDVWNYHPVSINEILKALTNYKREMKIK